MFDNILTVGLQVLVLFLLVFVGYVFGKTGLLKEESAKGLTNLVLYIATPAAILQSFTSEIKTPEKTKNLFLLFLGSVLIHVITILLAKLFIREKDTQKSRVMQFAVIFSNCGYMSFPLQKALLGDIGVFYGAMFVAVFNIITWTYGAYLMSGDKKNISPKKILLNPTIISVFISILLYLSQFKLPSFLSSAVTHLGNLNTPLPMIIVGFNLSSVGILKVFSDKKIYWPTFLRLAAAPALSFGVLWLIGITGIPLIACTVAASAPAAAISVMFANKFGGDAALGSKIVSLSTLLSIITMPVFVAFAQMI